MQDFGQGYCDSGFYAGWHGQGVSSEEDCKNLCLGESKCTFAAYYNEKVGQKSCSRYYEPTCNLLVSTSHTRAHMTFRKSGSVGEYKNNSNLMVNLKNIRFSLAHKI